MLTSPSNKPNVRQWLSQCESCIYQGGAGLGEALSNHEGHIPDGLKWASIANIILSAPVGSGSKSNRIDKDKRIGMLQVWLDHPDRPQLSPALLSSVLGQAVSHPPAHECIPLLNQYGFAFQKSREKEELVVKEIKKGRWPYPDLIAPQVTESRDYHFDLGSGVLRFIQSPAKIERFIELTPSPLLVRTISRLLGGLESELRQLENSPVKFSRAVDSFTILAKNGWLDLIEVGNHAGELSYECPRVSKMIALVQEGVLQQQTASVVSINKQKALRL